MSDKWLEFPCLGSQKKSYSYTEGKPMPGKEDAIAMRQWELAGKPWALGSDLQLLLRGKSTVGFEE